jgi:hypothetical protein
MRDKTHLEQVERWAKFFKENPVVARKELNKFIDAQIFKSREFYKRLSKSGMDDKVKKLRELKIKN